MTHAITLFNAQQGHEVISSLWTWLKPRLLQGRSVTLSVAEEKRTLPQNDKLQKLVREIGKAIDYKDHDLLRVLLCEKWRHETSRPAQYVRSLDGLRMVDVSNRTSNKDKGDMSEFIEWLESELADLAAAGVSD
jgi:hypothetical protein